MLKITQPLVVAAMLATTSFSAHATVNSYSWMFSTSNLNNTNCVSCANSTSEFVNHGNTYTFQTADTSKLNNNNVSVNAFSTTKNVTSTGTDSSSDRTEDAFETATIRMWNGLGIISGEDVVGSKKLNGTMTEYSGQPHHSMDNDGGINTTTTNNTTPDEVLDGGDVDAALFSFAEAINLTSITIGWTNGSADENLGTKNAPTTKNDVDISILAYTGKKNGTIDVSLPEVPNPIARTATPTETAISNTFTSLLASGWEFVGHYADLKSQTSNPDGSKGLITNGTTSKYWLISAYTSFADGNGSDANLDFGNDYFKIAGLSGKSADATTTAVPEPASLVLLSLGLMGWRATRNNQHFFNKTVVF